MRLQMRLLSVGRVAYVALVWFLTSMQAHMSAQSASVGEAFAAGVACERSFTRMSTLVYFQVCPLPKRLLAEVARKRFRAGMVLHMNCKRILARVVSVADLAHKPHQTIVHKNRFGMLHAVRMLGLVKILVPLANRSKFVSLAVGTKAARTLEELATQLARVFLFLRVNRDVIFKSCFLDESASTEVTKVAFVACMRTHVPLKVVDKRKCLMTDVTCVRPLTRMNTQVQREMIYFAECLATRRTYQPLSLLLNHVVRKFSMQDHLCWAIHAGKVTRWI